MHPTDLAATVWRVAASPIGRVAVLLALPVAALFTPAGGTAAATIVAGYGIGLLPVWLRRQIRNRDANHPSGRREYMLPQELPSAPAFVGRDRELAELRAASTAPSVGPRVIVIHGPAGIGKTALALHFGQSATGKFDDGQLFARLRGRRCREDSDLLVEVLSDFVTALLSPQDPPPPRELPRLLAWYAELTRSRRLLIVLDDAVDADLVRQLLPAGAGCLTIVTCRESLDIPVTAELPLEPLLPDDGLHLFRTIVGDERVRDPEEQQLARQIVRQSLHHPSALRLVGAMVSTRSEWSLAPVARLLGTDDRAPQEALDLGYALLTEDEQRAVRLLGVLPEHQPLAPWMLAALLEVPAAAARKLADRLVHAGLVERVDGSTAGVTEYHVHDYVHHYARRLASTAGDLPRLEAMLAAARGQRAADHDAPTLQRRVLAMQDRGDLAEALTAAREAVAWALDQHSPGHQALAQATLAEIYLELGNLEAAEDLARAALKAASSAQDPVRRAHALCATGRLLRRQGQPVTALRYLTRALDTLDEAPADDPPERIRLLRHRAAAYRDARRPEEGLADLDHADRLDRVSGQVDHDRPSSMRAGLLWIRGLLSADQGRPEEAVTLLTRAAEAAHGQGQRLRQAWITVDRSRIRTGDGQTRPALEDAYWALDAFSAMSHRYGAAKCRLAIADALLAPGATPRRTSSDPLADAASELQSALETFRNCGDRWIEASTAVALAQIRDEQHRGDDAAALRQAARIGFITVDDRVRAAQVERDLRLRRSLRRWFRPARHGGRSGVDIGPGRS